MFCKKNKSMFYKKVSLFCFILFCTFASLSQGVVAKTIEEDISTYSGLEKAISTYMFDTLVNQQYSTFEKHDTKGNVIIRGEDNEKPAFIYCFMTNCKGCEIDFIDVFPKLLTEFKDKIDFILLTPSTIDQLESEKNFLPDLPIIILPRTNFKFGFPMAYLLDRQNNIIITRSGGAGGTSPKHSKKIHYNILKKWFLKVIEDK